MRAIFIGRFQPFHNGHLSILKKIIKENDSVIVAIGSAQYSNTPQNPFSAGERIVIINKILKELNAKEFYIVPIEDVGNDELWASKIETLSPAFEVVYTNNPITRRIFAGRDYIVKSPGLIKRDRLSATNIRKLMSSGKNWKNLVPHSVADEIIRINGVDRLKILMRAGLERF
ncbi:MAG: nicotinamide-nucleotide adenylyltransferase [Candidatus Parvarchaeota archaeon]|nr:nicotinamide-nucleotide adenylyltransferase [Candidatus Parvarchaeota archaeon]MCL5101536.1 nicotinamide-nucleotide adenylyltransferase [Candidatus Parvarchaeota archaeon]